MRSRGRLYDERRIEVPVFARKTERLLRYSVAAYTEERDLEALADALDGTALAAPAERVSDHLRPEHDEEGDAACADQEQGREEHRPFEREAEGHAAGDQEQHASGGNHNCARRHAGHRSRGCSWLFSECGRGQLLVGDDYVVEFLGYRFSFNADDFEQRVTAAAVKLGLLAGNELDEEETGDLVELAADGVIAEPRSGFGRDAALGDPLARPGRIARVLAPEARLPRRGSTIASRRGCWRWLGTTTRPTSATAIPRAAGRCSSWLRCPAGTTCSSAAERALIRPAARVVGTGEAIHT